MRRTLLPVLLALALAGCSQGATPDRAAPAAGDPSLLRPYGEELPEGGEAAGGSAAGSSGSAARALAPGAGTDASTGDSAPAESMPAPPDAPLPPSGPLRAGSVDDNARFEDFVAYLGRTTGRVEEDPLDVRERHVVTVTDRAGRPVLGARVELLAGDDVVQTARTHAGGRALLFPRTSSRPDAEAYGLRVRLGRTTSRGEIADRADREHAVRLDADRPDGPVRLDLHFLLDTTGSMGDEIDRLRSTLDDVAARIDALPQEPEVRYGLTLYRDHGDAYVSRTHDFTGLAEFRQELAGVEAGGGGDTPEALDEALHGAVNGPAWDSDRAVQIAFLVADASPHLGGGQEGPSYAQDVRVAAEKGIEVVPLASSGTDDPAELVFRQLAQYTQGTFFFLTYGADGRSPGDSTDRDVSGFETGALDELVVGHVRARLAALEGRAGGQ